MITAVKATPASAVSIGGCSSCTDHDGVVEFTLRWLHGSALVFRLCGRCQGDIQQLIDTLGAAVTKVM